MKSIIQDSGGILIFTAILVCCSEMATEAIQYKAVTDTPRSTLHEQVQNELDRLFNESPSPATPTSTLPTIIQEKTVNLISKISVGQPCDPMNSTSSCVSKSSCTQLPSSDEFLCTCDENYVVNWNRECVRSHGSVCSYIKNECDQDSSYMVCINNHCTCENSDEYNPLTQKCEGKVGGFCFNSKQCIINAECFKSQTREQGVCGCQVGFVESENGHCLLGYGRACTRTDECDHLNLACKEGFCTCSDSLHVYNFYSKTCVALVGAQCSDETGGTMCIDLAYCKRINTKLPGRCACLQHSMESDHRTCNPVSQWRVVQ